MRDDLDRIGGEHDRRFAAGAGAGGLSAQLRSIFEQAVAAVDPAEAVDRELLPLAAAGHPLGRRCGVLAVGKGSLAMWRAARAQLEPRRVWCAPHALVVSHVDTGEVPLSDGPDVLAGVIHRVAEHPVPGSGGVAAAAALERAVGEWRCTGWLVLLSGGASALLPSPCPGITLADKQRTTELLLGSGASIEELNTVRRHLSKLKGGGLARLLSPAPVLVLAVSDVVSGGLSALASGPLTADTTTFADALAIVRDRLGGRVPEAVLRLLEDGARGELEENPGPGDPVFDRVEHRVVADNRLAVAAAAARCEELGYRPVVAPHPLCGEASDAARLVARAMQRAAERVVDAAEASRRSGVALVFGGETTVTVRGDGLGGRNQELALAVALELEREPPRRPPDRPWALLAAGTDGRDGPTAAAGAVVDGDSLRKMRSAGVDPAVALARNDSHRAHAAAGALFVTGATGTNVADLTVALLPAPAG